MLVQGHPGQTVIFRLTMINRHYKGIFVSILDKHIGNPGSAKLTGLIKVCTSMYRKN